MISAEAAYYVDASATTGNIVGDGSAISPWQTITYALTQVSSGATINVLAGTYSASMTGSSETFPIVVTNSVKLVGVGKASTTVEGSNSSNVFQMDAGTSLSSMCITGFSGSSARYGIYVYGNGVEISDSAIIGGGWGSSYGAGIYLTVNMEL